MLPENPQPPEPGQITRRDCAVWSAVLFAAAFAAGLVAEAVLVYAFAPRAGATFGEIAVYAMNMLFIGTPPVALLGAIVGFELYRVAAGSRAPRETKWYIWVLLFLIFGFYTIGIYERQLRRKSLLMEHGKPALMAPVVYTLLACLIFIALTALDNPTRSRLDSFIYGAAIHGSVFVLLAADCLAVNSVARCMHDGKLAPPESHTFQFSLATLFYGTLLLGAYATGLAALFR